MTAVTASGLAAQGWMRPASASFPAAFPRALCKCLAFHTRQAIMTPAASLCLRGSSTAAPAVKTSVGAASSPSLPRSQLHLRPSFPASTATASARGRLCLRTARLSGSLCPAKTRLRPLVYVISSVEVSTTGPCSRRSAWVSQAMCTLLLAALRAS